MNIGIVGPGRLGRTLAALLTEAGANVDVVRDDVPDGAVVLLTVPDRAIAEAARRFNGRQVVLLHCSGALPGEVLRPHWPVGSFHPLMTFPGPEVAVPDLAGVAAAIDGDDEAMTAAREIAGLLGMNPVHVPGDRRLYHAAAVMAGNFATVLLAEASKALVAAGVDEADAPSVLAPLALQSLRNAADATRAGHPIAKTLTGPVARGDHHVIDAHRTALAEADLADLVGLYDAMTRRAQELIGGSGG